MERTPIEFTAALCHLQDLIGTEVSIALNAYGQFFGAGFTGELVRIETLPPDHTAIRLVLGSGHGFFLDPGDVEVAQTRGEEGEEWLELQTAFGIAVTIEAISTHQPPTQSP